MHSHGEGDALSGDVSGFLVLANAGVPFILKGMSHLAVGNVVLGVLEGYIASRILRVDRRRATCFFIGANFASFLVGGALNRLLYAWLSAEVPGHRYIQLTQWVLLATIASALLLTLVIEYPFAWFVAPKTKRRWLKAAVVTLAVHAITFPLILLWYVSSSRATLYTAVSHDHSMSFVRPEHRRSWVYFIDQSDPTAPKVCRIRMDGTERSELAEVPWVEPSYELYLERADVESWGPASDLWICSDDFDAKEYKKQIVVDSVTPAKPPRGQSWGMYEPVDWRPEADRAWKFYNGLSAKHQPTGRAISLFLMHPYDFDEVFYKLWDKSKRGAILPGDVSVSQFGTGSGAVIVVFDLPQRKLGVLTRGASPVVVPAE